ncbi:MAG: IS200/IS605 family transposase [Bacteroidales bacterium]|jgi:REP element-mobilizing transposase RayT|nr:IS200/IS605 family transposase [Bacteroidales bacterium]
MANTYTQIHIHVVFSVKNRASLIKNEWENKLHQYIVGIIQNYGHKVLAINGTSDHIHILFGFRPAQSLSVLMQNVKRDSSAWINQNKFVKGHFSWQEGYGGFSYSKSQLPQIINYILTQKEHHKKHTFLEEYKKILEKFEIEYDEKYIFSPTSG